MEQLDLFDTTLEKKIYRLEKWMGRLQKEMWYLKMTYEMRETIKRQKQVSSPKQIEMAL